MFSFTWVFTSRRGSFGFVWNLVISNFYNFLPSPWKGEVIALVGNIPHLPKQLFLKTKFLISQCPVHFYSKKKHTSPSRSRGPKQPALIWRWRQNQNEIMWIPEGPAGNGGIFGQIENREEEDWHCWWQVLGKQARAGESEATKKQNVSTSFPCLILYLAGKPKQCVTSDSCDADRFKSKNKLFPARR